MARRHEMSEGRPVPAGRPRRALAYALLASLMAAPALAATPSALDLYYQRALMSAAGARCRLFTPGLASALSAAEAQARSAALRAGASAGGLQGVAGRAAAAAARQPCGAPELRLAAAQVRAAFAGYGRLLRMTFPGELAAWRADRSLPVSAPVWRLAQTASSGGGRVTFGLAGDWSHPAVLVAVADFGPGAQPYAARLLVRSPALAPEPYLDDVGAGAGARLPLSARTPPRAAMRVFPAEARAPADASLAGAGPSSALAFRFPPEAVAAIAALDPREAVTLEFLIQGRTGDIVRRAYVEVGDFAAGQAFLQASAR